MHQRGYAPIFVPAILVFQALGCGGLDPTVREQPSTDHAAVPPMTVERLRDCVKEYGEQLNPGSWAFSPQVKVDTEGYLVDVHAGAIPENAADLAACTREALGAMHVPSSILQLRPVASMNATNRLAQPNGFWGNPQVRIPLPGVLGQTQQTLSRMRMSGPLDQLQENLNHAAESVMPQAATLFTNAVRTITCSRRSARPCCTWASSARPR